MSERIALGDETFVTVLVAAQAGARWACTRLWSDHAPAVAAFLTARGSREPDDLTSEVFLTVFSRLGSFQGDSAAFRSFVFSVAYRRLVDELRMRGRRGETVELTAEEDPRRASSAEDEATARIGDQRALAVIDTLPADQRGRHAVAHRRRPHRRAGCRGTRQATWCRQSPATPCARAAAKKL